MKTITTTYITKQVTYPLYLVRYGLDTLEIEQSYKKETPYQKTIVRIDIQLPIVINATAEKVKNEITALAWQKLKEENIIGEDEEGDYYLKKEADA